MWILQLGIYVGAFTAFYFSHVYLLSNVGKWSKRFNPDALIQLMPPGSIGDRAYILAAFDLIFFVLITWGIWS